MRWEITVALAVGTVVAQLGCTHPESNSAVVTEDTLKNQTTVPGQYLVTLAPEIDVQAIVDVYGRFGLKSTRDLARGIFLVTLTDDPGLATMKELRNRDARIAAVQPNFVYRGQN